MERCEDCGKPGYMCQTRDGRWVTFCKECVEIEIIGKLVDKRYDSTLDDEVEDNLMGGDE